MKSAPLTESAEWLEPDGLGGFASGTAVGMRTRRYQALLLTATSPPTGRFVLVNGFEAWVETDGGRFALSTHRYAPDVVYPDGRSRLQSFLDEPWPTWRWSLDGGQEITLELFVPHEISACVLCWRLAKPAASTRLIVRPLLSGRDYHGLQRENAAFRFDLVSQSVPELDVVTWKPYDSVPATSAFSNGRYRNDPEWFRNFLYVQERERGLDCIEDLASPGTFSWPLGDEAVLILAAEGHVEPIQRFGTTAAEVARKLRESERSRRAVYSNRLERSVDAYIARRGLGKTIVAGYPWFTDWGRDTFIAIRGLCLETGRFDEARDILVAWAGTISEGMLPNRFPDQGDVPEFNSVDASLWYIVAVHDYLTKTDRLRCPAAPAVKTRLQQAVENILSGYFCGTRYGIRCDDDGLLAAGTADTPLTWMDARVDGSAVTGRVGKPVEVEALWLSGLRIGSTFNSRWQGVFNRGRDAFQARFWNQARGCLFDVVDVDHRKGTVDETLRPNQIFAVGGLPWTFLEPKLARRVVDVVEARLWTPMGLRTLEPGAPGYCGQYLGPPSKRDSVYHQGTVWPWLAGPFVEAWVRVRGQSSAVCNEARSKFFETLTDHLDAAGLGHLSEIADGDPPHTPRGCPFQAWSLGELIRLTESVLSQAPQNT
jgi:predicted glycogen debranching enzyme